MRSSWPEPERLARRVEVGAALAALAVATSLTGALLILGTLRLQRSNLVSVFVGLFAGPVLALAGAWLDAERGQAFGLLLLVLAALLALDGAVATVFVALPVLALVLLSLAGALLRRRRAANAESRSD